MIELIPPTERLRDAWTRAHLEWGPGLHEDGFGLLASDDVDDNPGFAAWVARIQGQERSPSASGAGVLGCLFRWIVEDGAVLGGIAARWGDSAYISRNGHIGYGVTPSARGHGVATWALGRVIADLGARGVRSVLLVCEAANAASAATIQRNGGVLDGCSRQDAAHRYWIDIDE